MLKWLVGVAAPRGEKEWRWWRCRWCGVTMVMVPTKTSSCYNSAVCDYCAKVLVLVMILKNERKRRSGSCTMVLKCDGGGDGKGGGGEGMVAIKKKKAIPQH